jgi:hypothetical protein
MSYNPGGPAAFSDGESEFDEVVEWSGASDSRSPTRASVATPRVLEKHREVSFTDRMKLTPRPVKSASKAPPTPFSPRRSKRRRTERPRKSEQQKTTTSTLRKRRHV